MRLLKEIIGHPVEIAAGLALVVLGVVLTAKGADPEHASASLLTLGGVATALGGVLMTWTVGKVVSKRDALNEMRSQLDLVSRNLGQASGQISRAVEECQADHMPAATGFALVSQSAMTIYAQVTAIQNILGDKFDAQDLLDTVTELEDLAKKLARTGADTTTNEVAEVTSRLQEMRTELARSTVARTRASELVECPSCLSPTKVLIGVNGGDTARSHCPRCERSFNTHRRPDGSVFARLIGSATVRGEASQTATKTESQTVSISSVCPECQTAIELTSHNPLDPSAICTHCGTNIRFDVAKGMAEVTGHFDIIDGVVSGRFGSGGSGGRPTVTCDQCGRTLRCIIKKSDALYAIDSDCRRLYRIYTDSWDAWRQVHEVKSMQPPIPFVARSN